MLRSLHYLLLCWRNTHVVRCIGVGTRLLTVRVETELWEAAARRAEALGTSVSEIVREALRESVDARPLGDRVGHLRGAIKSHPADSSHDPWHSELRAQNWRS